MVWEDVESYGITDDSPLTYPLIKDKLIAINVSLIKDAWRKKEPIDMCYSYDHDIDIECVKESVTINGITITSDVVMYTADLPHLVPEIGWADISYFGTQAMKQGMMRKGISGFMSSDGAVWTANYPVYTVVGDTAIIKNMPTQGFSKGTLVAIREDPTSLSSWDSNDESEFPTPSPYKLIMLTRNEILKSLGRPDLVTDAQRQFNAPQQKQETRNEEN